MKIKILILSVFSTLLFACNSEPTLQKYFVESTNSNDFIVVDLTTNVLKLDKSKLSSEENLALNSLGKLNILAFKLDPKMKSRFASEKNKVQQILKNKKYQELMKMSSGQDGGAVYFVEDKKQIDEFVLFASSNKTGFAVVRVLGDNMNASSIMTLLEIIKKTDLNIEQLKPLEAMIP